MFSLNCIFLATILLSPVLGLPAREHEEREHEDISPKSEKYMKYTIIDDEEFRTENITVSYSTGYDSNLNISAVSPDNNPDEKLLLYYDIMKNVSVPGLLNFTLGCIYTGWLNPYEKTDWNDKCFISVPFVLKGGSITANVTFTAVQSLLRNIDFSNFDKRSRIEYNIKVISETNITWITDSIESKIVEEIENLPVNMADLNISELKSDILVPLVNATGHDDSFCHNEKCLSSTEHKWEWDDYYLFDDITVVNSKEISSTVASDKYTSGSNTTYTIKSTIDIQYVVVIGQHRC